MLIIAFWIRPKPLLGVLLPLLKYNTKPKSVSTTIYLRSTPAYAGKTLGKKTGQSACRDHPRLRGKDAIYIEKHPDARHGERGEYLELFSAVRDGKKIILFKIIAKEGERFAGRYTIVDVKFYDILQQKKGIPHHLPHKDRQNGGIPFNNINVADLLAGVNDRQGIPYVNHDGTGSPPLARERLVFSHL